MGVVVESFSFSHDNNVIDKIVAITTNNSLFITLSLVLPLLHLHG